MKEGTKSNIIIILILAGIVSLISPIFLTMLPVEDNVLIDGDDVVSYNIINEDEIEIVTDDDIYIIDLYFDNEVVDFTVNSNIHIELERFDTRLFWWDFIIHNEPVFPDEYRLGRIIKVPEGD